ncbi:hypothetical protein F441_08290 [Phytophthora nicotianae CJ01A1]|uniref:Uncharacterized protein n=4 Tax=Phytophthora nicotianae TaxID=4792 RepID=V9FAT6_PHYNI|nr:hypothetical protein F443_08304 [Phytophthora nicotianae P1569]ETK87431.1 hypothetical protein L915_08135 [Phytophthora nicotianae]ETO76199.1 hypothetical protein F444_08368 [Phytophthora nicotianae P1976]ETP17281.1 hypothetical protein F441_08290 [Phytophthora nicotianae CJ01A1]ETL40863.1 hypothetical protein L916_08057 [Phytophthora nicotianae]
MSRTTPDHRLLYAIIAEFKVDTYITSASLVFWLPRQSKSSSYMYNMLTTASQEEGCATARYGDC